MINNKKIKLFIAFSLFLSIIFAFKCAAANRDAMSIESFVSPVGAWSADDGAEVELTTLKVGELNTPCLMVNGTGSSSGDSLGVSGKFRKSIDLSSYRAVRFDVFVKPYEGNAPAVYYVETVITSADGSRVTSLSEAEGGQWSSAETLIGSWNGRRDITSIDIFAVVKVGDKTIAAETFYVSRIYADLKVDTDMTGRFSFSEYTVWGGNGSTSHDKTRIILSSDTSSPLALGADVHLPRYGYEVNCLKIKLNNRTDSDTLTVRYDIADADGNITENTAEAMIVPNSDGDAYYIPMADVSRLTGIELEFNNGKGTVELLYLGAAYSYEHYSYDVCGKITSCTIDSELKNIRFTGMIDRETAQKRSDAEIGIFIIDSESALENDSFTLGEPVVKGSMSTRFDLTWTLPSSNPHARYSCFAAAVIGADGSYELIAPPFYIDDPAKSTKTAYSFSEDAKGFAASDVSAVGDVGTGVTYLELDFSRVFAPKASAAQYVYNGELYYFNKEYLDTLTNKISVYKDLDIDVILGYVGWSAELSSQLASAYSAETYKGYTKNSSLDDGTDLIGAVSAYTANVWCGDGAVKAVILGDGENRFYTGAGEMADKIADTAENLRKIYNNLISVNNEARVYVSLDPLFEVSKYENISAMPISEYLPALIARSAVCGKFGWEAAITVSEVHDGANGTYISPDSCAPLLELLSKYNCSEKDVVFVDQTYSIPSEHLSTVMYRYTVGYYSALFNDRIDAYIADVGADTLRLWETVRYIDTDLAKIISQAALLTVSAKDFSEIIPGYTAAKLPARKLATASVLPEAPGDVKGEYKYFAFDAVSDLEGISSGYYCKYMEIVKDTESALSLQLDSSLYGKSGTANWMGILHNYEYSENLKYTPIIALTLKIDGVSPSSLTSVPVKLVLTGKKGQLEVTGTAETGAWTTLYFDISDFSDIERTNRIQILFGDSKLDLATVLIRDIRGISFDYTHESLDSIIEEVRLRRRTSDAAPDYSRYIIVAAGILVAAATAVTFVLLSKRKREDVE